MFTDPIDLLPGRIIIVDDEQQIYASIRLRLAEKYDLTYCSNPIDALAKLGQDRFDVCLADISMPEMNGLRFIDAARKIDPQLGYVVISAFATDDNLRRTIPLQVYDFISKPLPERPEFEGRIFDWVESTRKRRRDHALAQRAGTLASERDSARMERDVELVASESARDALLQTAGLLTTTDAHYLNACSFLGTRVKSDPSLMPLLRAMEEGRRATAAMGNVIERFFGSSYGSRDNSPALVNEGILDAINLAKRDRQADRLNKAVHFSPIDLRLPLRGLSGIAFLLMMFPALSAALTLAVPNTTVGVRGDHCTRLDSVFKDPKLRSNLWVNRNRALISQSGWVIVISSNSPALTRSSIEQWFKGEYAPLSAITPRGIIEGVQKCHGLLGFAIAPHEEQFRLYLALPT
jgi:CheY-like chemotaxis protein